MGRKLKYDKLNYTDYIGVFIFIIILMFFIVKFVPITKTMILKYESVVAINNKILNANLTSLNSTTELAYFIPTFNNPTILNYTNSMDCYSLYSDSIPHLYSSQNYNIPLIYCANTSVNTFSFKINSNVTQHYFINYTIIDNVCNTTVLNYTSSATNCSYDNFSYINPNYTYFSEHWKYYFCGSYYNFCEVTNSSTVNQYLIYENNTIVKINNNNSS